MKKPLNCYLVELQVYYDGYVENRREIVFAKSKKKAILNAVEENIFGFKEDSLEDGWYKSYDDSFQCKLVSIKEIPEEHHSVLALYV